MQPIVTDEAKRVVDEAMSRGIVLRLFGGVAVRFHCPSATHRSLQRSYPDLDFFGTNVRYVTVSPYSSFEFRKVFFIDTVPFFH